MDTLAVRLTLPTTKRVVDFHHQAIAHGGRTTKKCRRFHCGVRGSNRIRTYDTSGMNRMLWPAELLSQMVAGVGLEPTTSGL